MNRRIALPFCLIVALAPLLLIGACETSEHIATSLDLQADPAAGLQEPRFYPEHLPVGQPLEIEIIRTTRKRIAIENRTPQPWDGGTLWLNRQYGGTLDALPIGKTGGVALVHFINEHGEHFPVGSFLEPEIAATLVAADLEVNGQMHKLVVRLVDNWQNP